MSDPTIKLYNYNALMRMKKVELLAIMDELGLDPSLLPKETKGEMAGAILSFAQYAGGIPMVNEEPVIPINPLNGRPNLNIPANTMIGSAQQSLRPTSIEKSVRIKRIEESQQ